MSRALRTFCALLFVTAAAGPLAADRVSFRDGNYVDNVRVLLFGGRVNLVFEDGSIQVYREDQIDRIENRSVSWIAEIDEEDFEREARLRIFKLQESIRERERARLEAKARERRSTLYYSLAFPGLGQFVDGSPVRGSLFSVAAAALSVSLVGAHADRHEAQRDYEDIGRPFLNIVALAQAGPFLSYFYQERYFRERFAAFREARDTYDSLWGALLGIWLISAIDAYFFSETVNWQFPGDDGGTAAGWPELRLSPRQASIAWSFAL
ncbi:MAG: hypothetical protein NXI24_08145 [bacterium]|nr:hypothetical protein [bacterium]